MIYPKKKKKSDTNTTYFLNTFMTISADDDFVIFPFKQIFVVFHVKKFFTQIVLSIISSGKLYWKSMFHIK